MVVVNILAFPKTYILFVLCITFLIWMRKIFVGTLDTQQPVGSYKYIENFVPGQNLSIFFSKKNRTKIDA